MTAIDIIEVVFIVTFGITLLAPVFGARQVSK